MNRPSAGIALPVFSFRSLCLCASVVIVSAGCSSNRPPEVTLESARVIDRTPEGIVIELTLVGANENTDGLPLKSVDYTLTLNGKTVYSGRRAPEATLSGEASRRLRVPAPIALGGDVRAGEAEFAVTGSLTYIEPGKIAEILFDAEVSQPTVSFSGAGRVDLGAK